MGRRKPFDPSIVPDAFWAERSVQEALVRREIGEFLKLYVSATGASQTDIAACINRSQPEVWRFVNTDRKILTIDLLTDIADGLAMPDRARLLMGLAPASVPVSALPGPTRSAAGAGTISPRSRVDPAVQPPSRGTVSGSARDVPAVHDEPVSAAILPETATLLAAPLEEIVAYLGDLWHMLVRADNLFGPAHARMAVMNQVRLIEMLLPDARGTFGVALLRLGAQYAESAAWLYEDAGELPSAGIWTNRALEWAHAANDMPMVAWALFRRSQQAASERDGARAVGLARAAQRNGDHLPDPMRAAIAQQEAHGLALDGDESACHAKLDDAHRFASPIDPHGDASHGHGSFCSASYIELQRANCLMTLGRPARAVPLYRSALSGLPPAYHRDHGFGLARLAGALVAVGETEGAADAADRALAIGAHTGSARTLHAAEAVGSALRPQRRLPAVARLLEHMKAAFN